MTLALLVRIPLASSPDLPTVPTGPVRQGTTATLAGRLNLEWARLCEAPSSDEALNRWAVAQPVLAGARSLDDLRAWVGCDDVEARDAVLLALLELAQSGEQLAGRTVLQAMLGKAVRVGNAVAGRPDMHGDREEAVSVAVAALWQVIATYPVIARPSRVAANLALDTVALVQRGHTGSSFFRRTFPEMPVADLRTVGEVVHHDVGPDEPTGPADAQLYVLLAWGVRAGVLDLDAARLLARVYTVDQDGVPVDGRAIAALEGISWSTLRQRCNRLAHRLGAAAANSGASPSAGRSPGAVAA